MNNDVVFQSHFQVFQYFVTVFIKSLVTVVLIT